MDSQIGSSPPSKGNQRFSELFFLSRVVFIGPAFPNGAGRSGMSLWVICNDLCCTRRIAVHQRPKLAARELGECIREQQYRYGELEWDLGEKPKMRFATIIQPLTLSRRFLTPRKVTYEVLQWLVSRSLAMVLSLGLHLARGRAVGESEDGAEEKI